MELELRISKSQGPLFGKLPFRNLQLYRSHGPNSLYPGLSLSGTCYILIMIQKLGILNHVPRGSYGGEMDVWSFQRASDGLTWARDRIPGAMYPKVSPQEDSVRTLPIPRTPKIMIYIVEPGRRAGSMTSLYSHTIQSCSLFQPLFLVPMLAAILEWIECDLQMNHSMFLI